jgi:lysophospholipase
VIETRAVRNNGFFEGVGRLRLHFESFEVPNAAAAVLVVHGLAEHTGRYEALAASFGARGISTFTFDLRGHGGSEGRRGHVGRFDMFLQDLDRFRREVGGLVRSRTPLFLLGHSMGGLIALRYLQEYDAAFHGAIITSPWLGTIMTVPRWKVLLGTLLERVLPSLPLRAGVRAEDLSHDPDIVARYREDPLVHDRITPRLFREVSTAMGLVSQRSGRIAIPLLFLIAGADRIVDADRAASLARTLADGDVAVHVLPGQYHEVLNEREREATIALITGWIFDRLEPA